MFLPTIISLKKVGTGIVMQIARIPFQCASLRASMLALDLGTGYARGRGAQMVTCSMGCQDGTPGTWLCVEDVF